MKTTTFLIILIISAMTNSCSSSLTKNPKNWNDKELSQWFHAGEWKSGWDISPNKSINKKELAIQFFKNKERWKQAFEFLASNDLEKLSIGRYDLDGDNLFVKVEEYETKDENDARFEAHKKYVDIQYLVFGEERIGISQLKNTTELIPYDNLKDISFFTAKYNNYQIASPSTFFIFFPEDAHRPCVKTGKKSKVRKVVVKVRIN
ncbi:DUF386 domain-containing protein [Arenibacter aquaticus]|uniref:DUF386 domain-containing protein n=1 Tax=Arenibacter aquaticus TaxID=2489054 RepID=A0A3S0AQF2_9FLAO|nr:YhcH/YjgK/YiaL family protein [Arenibacter aquaticus]RTE55386.1 DUF386 domain-containing protein [Arenibacter aquaticus]